MDDIKMIGKIFFDVTFEVETNVTKEQFEKNKRKWKREFIQSMKDQFGDNAVKSFKYTEYSKVNTNS